MSAPLKAIWRSAFLAPPWRLRCDPTRDPLTLYTIQSVAAFEKLCLTGELHGDPALGEEHFSEAYAWLSARMRDRLGRHGAGEGMLWLWARERRRALVDQLRADPAAAVLLTVSVARERVLLTDFDDWHDVLNRRRHVPARQGESNDQWWDRAEPLMDEWEGRVGKYRSRPLSSWPAALRSDLESSWLPIVVPGPSSDTPHVQATIRALRLGDVVRAVRVG